MASDAQPRVATPEDVERVTAIFTAAFHDDPVWGWAFPDPERRTAQHTVFWRLFVEGALPHGWVWLTADDGAAALWIPPGCPELPEEVEAELEPLFADLVGESQATVLMETFERLEAAHPRDRSHYYLSLLGTRPDYRGKGIGIGLLTDNLRLIDAEGMPAYLESSNPANNPRYGRLGFVQVGEFSAPGENGPPLATMWRDPAA